MAPVSLEDLVAERGELVSAEIAPVMPSLEVLRHESGQLREYHRRLGASPEEAAEAAARELLPIAGGATGIQAAAYAANLPEPGTFQMDEPLFYQETERNDVPQEQKAFTGLSGGVIQHRIANVGILAKLRLVFTGTLTVSGAGTCTATWQWPWNTFKEVLVNVNGQTSIIRASGVDLRARRQRIYRNPRDPVSSAPATSTDGIVDPNPGVIANGTYNVVLVYDIPITHDDYEMVGSIFAQSDQMYLQWQVTPAQTADLFTLAGGSTATLTGTIDSTLTFFDVPFFDHPQEGRKVLIPDLRYLHGYLASDRPFQNTGAVQTPFIRTAGQLISYTFNVENGPAAVVQPTALSEASLIYGGNRRPRQFRPVAHLLEKNAIDYNGRILPNAGVAVLDLEVDNPQRDLIYPKGVSELALEVIIPASVSLNANARVHFVEETLFGGAGGS
jgi:hypothetical protein